jgi:tyrosinase
MTPLTPFRNTNNRFWNSDDIRTPERLGYSYAETFGFAGDSITRVITAINTLYSGSNNKHRRGLTYDDDHYEWLANISVKKHASPESFFIHIFLGPFDPNSSTWVFEKNLVASHCIFTKPLNDRSDDDLFISATLPLTDSLLDKISNSTFKSLLPKNVMEFLNSNIDYRLTNILGKEINRSEVSSLSVSLVAAKVQMPRSSIDLPVWGEMVSYAENSATSMVSRYY